ncbi:hypothetical protein CF319_g3764 [Tilletia indica]|nr:hypothetical protein CF319_g3764 [Tilletia indica]
MQLVHGRSSPDDEALEDPLFPLHEAGDEIVDEEEYIQPQHQSALEPPTDDEGFEEPEPQHLQPAPEPPLDEDEFEELYDVDFEVADIDLEAVPPQVC